MRNVLALLLIAAPLWGQPFIQNKGVVNAASLMAPDLPGGRIAQGSVFAIYGTGLGPAASPSDYVLGTSLAEVSVKVFQGAKSVDALPIYVTATQVQAIMPSKAPPGRVSVQVTYLGQASNPAPLTVMTDSFGIFSVNGLGYGPGAIQNVLADNSQQANSAAQPATPGQIAALSGSGLGPVDGPDSLAPDVSLPTPVEVFIGGLPASVSYSGRLSPGIDQIVFTVPADAPLGCYVPIQVRTSGRTVSNAVTMAISSDGSACSDPASPLDQNLLSGGNYGAVLAQRVAGTLDQFTGSPPNFVFDLLGAALWSESGAPAAYNPLYSAPPRGSCTIFTVAGDLLTDTALPGLRPTDHVLDGGSPLRLSGAGASPALPLLAGVFFGLVGSNVPGSATPRTVFDPAATLTVSAPGGADVGPLQAMFITTSPVSWTNRAQLARVDRTQDLTFTWQGGDDQRETVVLGGVSSDTPTHSSAAFACLASPADSSFTVPSYVLANLPPTRSTEFLPKSWLFLGSIPLNGSTPFSAAGLDAGFALFSPWNAKTVVYR